MFNLTFKEAFTAKLQNFFPVLKTLQQKAKHEGLRGKKEADVEIPVSKKLKENILKGEKQLLHIVFSPLWSQVQPHFEIVKKVFHFKRGARVHSLCFCCCDKILEKSK